MGPKPRDFFGGAYSAASRSTTEDWVPRAPPSEDWLLDTH
ncbi:unannotated protein [freshwater metagenome]|uniref:Unannotated protein n=1 Tax=freshwater metagenome TaxID=449393 RepID=A0A6J6SMX8_9ZZZZ